MCVFVFCFVFVRGPPLRNMTFSVRSFVFKVWKDLFCNHLLFNHLELQFHVYEGWLLLFFHFFCKSVCL